MCCKKFKNMQYLTKLYSRVLTSFPLDFQIKKTKKQNKTKDSSQHHNSCLVWMSQNYMYFLSDWQKYVFLVSCRSLVLSLCVPGDEGVGNHWCVGFCLFIFNDAFCFAVCVALAFLTSMPCIVLSCRWWRETMTRARTANSPTSCLAETKTGPLPSPRVENFGWRGVWTVRLRSTSSWWSQLQIPVSLL